MLKKSVENIDNFHARLNALIKNQNTTQEWVCKQCEINLGTFRNRIVNKRLPDAFEACNIAEILHTSVEHLVTGEERGITHEEAELLRTLRGLSPANRNAVLALAAALDAQERESGAKKNTAG